MTGSNSIPSVKYQPLAIYSCFLRGYFLPAHQDQARLLLESSNAAELCCSLTLCMGTLCLDCAQDSFKTGSGGGGRDTTVKSGRTLPHACHFRSIGGPESTCTNALMTLTRLPWGPQLLTLPMGQELHFNSAQGLQSLPCYVVGAPLSSPISWVNLWTCVSSSVPDTMSCCSCLDSLGGPHNLVHHLSSSGCVSGSNH